MRVLITTTGYAGHFLPLAPFARAARAAGHEVRVAAPASRRATIERAGLELLPCADASPESIGRLLATVTGLGRAEGHAHMMAEGFARIATRTVLADVLETVASWRPHLIVGESQEYAGALAAESAGIPHVRVALGLAAQEDETISIVAGAIDELRAEVGLPGDPDARTLRESPLLTVVPKSLDEPGGELPARLHRFRQPREGTAPPPPAGWATGADPAVYLTFGSVAGLLGLSPRLYRTVIDQLEGLRARVLITIGEDADPAELEPLPPHVHVERWLPQDAVIAHADAVVCHGGYGSVLGALAHGVPVVGLPLFADDQFRNARRIAQVGAGVALPGGSERGMLALPEPETFAKLPGAVEAVLGDPRYRRAAREVAAEMEALPPIEASPDVLERIAQPSGASTLRMARRARSNTAGSRVS